MSSIFIHKTAIIDHAVEIGSGSKIWHFAHIREQARLGHNVTIGKNSFIDTNVHIGHNVKIQNFVSVYQGVTIKNNVFVGPHVAFTNDLHPRATGDWQLLKTTIEEGASIGANATILCGITLGKYCLIAAGAVVTKSVPSHALVAGNPGRPIGWVCHCARKIANKTSSGSHTFVCNHCQKRNTITVL